MAEYGYQSELCIPLVGGDRVIGLIDVFDTRPRDYAEYLDFLRSVGQTAAGVIENAAAARQARAPQRGARRARRAGQDGLERRRPQRAGALDRPACRGTHGGRRLPECSSSATTRCTACSPTTTASSSTTTRIARSTSTSSPAPGRPSPRRRRWSSRAPTTRASATTSGGLYHESGSQSEICVPLVLEDRVVGLLDVYDHRRRDYAEHRDFLLRVGQMMAGAFENALLMERLEESNQTLGLLVESGIEFGATLDRDEVLESVARRLCAATSAPNCDIFTLHGGRHPLSWPASITASRTPSTSAPSIRSSAWASCASPSRRGSPSTPRTSPPTRASASWSARRTSAGDTRRCCACRSSAGARSSAWPSIYDDHARRFERTDFLHSLAQVAAGALANATLFDELDRSAERMALVGDVSFELSSSLDLDEVLLSTARRLCAISGAPMCDIYRLRDGGLAGERDQHRRRRGRYAAGRAARSRSTIGRRCAGAVETREPVVIESRYDPRLSPAEIALMEQFGESSTLMVPLISRERVIGVLELTHREPQRSVLGRGDGDHRLDLPVRRAGDRQRGALRGHQGHAPQQPEGPQLGAQRQGLLHARPRRASRGLHGAARPGAGLAGRAPAGRRGGGLPARHRQDRRAGPGPAEAERTERARVGADAPAPHLQRRDHPLAVRRAARGRRQASSRALGRRRLPRRTRR